MILKEGDVSEIHMYIKSDTTRNKMDCHTREWGFPGELRHHKSGEARKVYDSV